MKSPLGNKITFDIAMAQKRKQASLAYEKYRKAIRNKRWYLKKKLTKITGNDIF